MSVGASASGGNGSSASSSGTGFSDSGGGGGGATSSESTTGSFVADRLVFFTSSISTKTGKWSDRPILLCDALCGSLSCRMPPPTRNMSFACPLIRTLS